MPHNDKIEKLRSIDRQLGSPLNDRELRLAILLEEALELAASLDREIRDLRAEMDGQTHGRRDAASAQCATKDALKT